MPVNERKSVQELKKYFETLSSTDSPQLELPYDPNALTEQLKSVHASGSEDASEIRKEKKSFLRQIMDLVWHREKSVPSTYEKMRVAFVPSYPQGEISEQERAKREDAIEKSGLALNPEVQEKLFMIASPEQFDTALDSLIAFKDYPKGTGEVEEDSIESEQVVGGPKQLIVSERPTQPISKQKKPRKIPDGEKFLHGPDKKSNSWLERLKSRKTF